MPTQEYIDTYAVQLGRVMGNLAFLERSLRSVLYKMRHPPYTSLPDGPLLLGMRQGDLVPLNWLTSWHTLGELVSAFNDAHRTHHPPFYIDPTLKTLRDALAHGRLVADDSSPQFLLVRFGKPKASIVAVEDAQELTSSWMDSQVGRTGDAIDVVVRRLRELYPD
jgi:hypothetical protein